MIEEHCGWEIGKDDQREQRIKVSPTPIYLEGTNRFDVLVQYRTLRGGRGKLISERHEGFSYLILRKPRSSLGKIFISFKQPEDLALSRKLNTLAERTGFETYRAVQDPTPGTDLWERITPEIEQATALFVIWTKHTLWGEGVQREMDIARRAKVPIILVIEQGMEPPEGFEGKVEYITFDPQDPAPAFAKCLQARRRITLGSR
ncbi:MAG TPA: toll/interleukin-1 receptor domain-containing protein [Candidatus Acidoferrales bacterium]|nr:toll/interleukin-1 receptor domain-containing protein [Candidatus Acidoferrales bacterium]